MVIVEILKDGEWIEATSHTLAVDAEASIERLIGMGYEARIKGEADGV